MSFKGTEHYRHKAQLFTHAVSYCDADGVKRYRALSYSPDVSELCDHLDQLQEVVEAARALISAMTGDKRYRDDLLEERCFEVLQDALIALEGEVAS